MLRWPSRRRVWTAAGLVIALTATGLLRTGDGLAQEPGWHDLEWTTLPTSRPYPRAFIQPFDFGEFYASAPVTDRRDASTINTMRERATGQGSELSLKLDASKTITFIDCSPPRPGCPLGMFHLLVAWWPQHQAYVVLAGGAGWSSAYLVSGKDGQMVVVSGNPVISPSGRYAVAQGTSSDPPDHSALEVIDLDSEPPRAIDSGFKSACPKHALGSKAVWLDDSSVTFEDPGPSNGAVPGADKAQPILRIADGKLDWRC